MLFLLYRERDIPAATSERAGTKQRLGQAAFLQTFLLVYVALFPVINPIGDAPVFLNLTRYCTPIQRHLLAQKIAIGSFVLLLGSMFIGSQVLSFFGIGLPVVQMGGGIVVAAADAARTRSNARHFSISCSNT
jgi:small neutral amino acid transporter SnatA (MarC family)